ncbi:6260_t:CDS:1 [Ambispora gerdemannii]|uniref:6260_t:CDS:1 n=1 Tax=Ambispora gerdemannii TaxID=144530 RepID=A0A9N9FKQ8_9GLOM|nr:6260_t:CDS:1 [Ambispora gerdemannii]
MSKQNNMENESTSNKDNVNSQSSSSKPSNNIDDINEPPPPYIPRESETSMSDATNRQHPQTSTNDIMYNTTGGVYNALPANTNNTTTPLSPPNPPQPSTTAIEYVPVMIVSRDPLTMYCPHCQQQVLTKVSRTPGARAYCCSVLMCFVCWPLFWVPCVMRGCQDEFHQCSKCDRVLAVIEDEP